MGDPQILHTNPFHMRKGGQNTPTQDPLLFQPINVYQRICPTKISLVGDASGKWGQA